MEHININKQPYSKKKKAMTITALVAAGAIIIGGTKIACNKKLKKQAEVTTDLQTETYENSDLYLSSDFDINDDNAVLKRAQDIYEISEKEYNVLDIKNTIYLYNGKYDRITYPENVKTDDEKFMYIQDTLTLCLPVTLNDYIEDYYTIMSGFLDEEEDRCLTRNITSMVYGYMFMSEYNDAKKMLMDLALICKEQINNIINKDIPKLSDTANKYYALYLQANSLELSSENKVILFQEFKNKSSLFARFLSEEKANDLNDAYSIIEMSKKKMFGTLSENLRISDTIKEGIDSGTFAKNEIKLEEKYKKEDKEKAEERAKNYPTNRQETKVVNNGGNKVTNSSGNSETKYVDKNNNEIKTPTTIEETSEFIVPVNPDDIPKDWTENGGDVIEEFTYYDSANQGYSKTLK